ncbi:hypothetical protein MKX01_035057 [Papaver californicum]|nr:hypothetical protein MKX01_035057 [Papaver californicum]
MYFSWRLTLLAFPLIILLIIPGIIYGKYLLHLSKKSHKEYSKADMIVEQALSSIKTVYSFTAEKRIVERYSTILDKTVKLGMKQGIAKGLAVGSTGLSFSIWAFLAWYGSHLVMYNGESGGNIYAAGITFVLSGLSLGVALPDLKYFTEASIAATRIYKRIDRVPIIDGEDIKGLVLDQVHGEIDFEHVEFTYPSRPDSIVLRDFNLKVVAHKLSTIKNADQIAVVSGGCIIENGSHSDLINKKNGHYAKLAKLQRQFSVDDHEMAVSEFRSSITRSSANRLSLTRSSPASSCFASPLAFDSTPITPFYPPPSFRRLLSLNSPEWKQGLIGSISAVVFGAVQPVYALTIGGMISAFFLQDHDEMKARIRTYTLIFSSLTVVSIIVNLIQHYNFAYMGERLTRRIRLRMLEKILTFEAAWFDQEQNSSGLLSSRLSNEASLVKSLVANRVSLLVQTSSAVIIAMIMGLVIAWKLALVMIAVQPLTILCFYTRKVLLSSISTNFVKAQHQSTQIAVEAVYNHRVVTSFGSVGKVLQIFDEAQEEPRKEATKRSWFAGIGMGSALCLTYMSWALDFWYGGKLVESGQISSGDVFKTFFILVSTGRVIAEAGSMTSDLAKGATAVASVFEVLDRQSLIEGPYQENDSTDSSKLERISGAIEINKVDFAYPSRPEFLVLRQFSLKVKAGTSIGFVGKSGCGKSTVIGMILRFYDVERGVIKVDGVDLRELNLAWYRGHTALVSQEPVIYSGTIRDNIVFGKLEASEPEVVEASKAANAHDFIS